MAHEKDISNESHNEESSLQVDSLVLSGNDDKFEEEGQQINYVDLNQQCDPQLDYCSDIKFSHDLIDLRMMEMFQEETIKELALLLYFLSLVTHYVLRFRE